MRLPTPTFLLALVLVTSAFADPVITEFLASNSTGLQDEDGDRSDWIEIHNPDLVLVDLAGWTLTDDATDLRRWIFPAVVLPPGGHLLVFASGKNRATGGGELHTDFSLDKDGEFLALVSPGGSVASEFSPAFPPQRPDLAYGTSSPTIDVTLLDESAPAKARAPDAAYDTLIGTTWRDNGPIFDDSSWLSGTLGVGYERSSGFGPEIGLDVEAAAYNENTSVYIRAAIPGTLDPASIVSLTLRMKFDDGFAAFLNGAYATGANDPDPLLWSSPSTVGVADDDAEVFQDFDISASIPDLEPSNNLLAIHGLNRTKNSSDLLIRPMLVARIIDPDTPSTTGYLDTPTPGAINGNTAFDGILTDTRFDVGRGFFDAPFTERLSSPDQGTTLIYTLDGSVPSLTNGIQVPAPNASTPPDTFIPITTTTVLRAIAVKANALSTNVDTQTYLFTNDVLTQDGAGLPTPSNSTSIWDYEMDPDVATDPRYPDLADDLKTLPTLSIALPADDMWGTNGIYANPRQSGFAWERGCSVEFLRPDGTPGFQEDAGIRIQGAGSRFRDLGKKSLRIVFRQLYGAGKLDYPLFGDGGAERLDGIVLRGSYFDSWTVHTSGSGTEYIGRRTAMLLRDEWGRQAHEDMGADPVVEGNWAHVYFNGIYWGVYNLHERIDEHFAEDRFGGNDEEYDVLKQRPRGSSNGSPPEVVQGDLAAWNTLLATLNSNITSPAVYESVRQQLDVDAFADYLVLNFWGANLDWPHNNWYAIRHRPSNGRFTFVAWDMENFLFRTNETSPLGTSTNNSPGIVWARLKLNDEFLLYFADRVHQHCFNGGALTPNANITRFEEITDLIRPAMNAESARWGDTRESPPLNTIDHFDPLVANKINTYFPARTDIFLNQLRSGGYYPVSVAPEFSRHGGQVSAGTTVRINNLNGNGTTYHTTDGSDPRLPGGSVNPVAQAGIGFTVISPLTAKARILSDSGEWSALTEADFVSAGDPPPGVLAVSELHYHPADATTAEQQSGFNNQDSFEFIELTNTGPLPVDLSNVAFTDGITFDFGTLTDPADRLLAPGARLVLANNTEAFALRYGPIPVAGRYAGALDNGGESIALTLDGTTALLAFTYNDDLPWPESPDGSGASLVLTSPAPGRDHSNPGNWQASSITNGAPGSTDTARFVGDPLADDNNDGLSNLVHFALTNGSAPPPAPTIALTTIDTDSPPDTYPTFTFQRNLNADVLLTVEVSQDLASWTTLDPASHLVSITNHDDGTALHTWRSPVPFAVPSSQFFRLRVTAP